MKVTIEQIEEALEKCGGFITVAAKSLGIKQPSLTKRIKKSKRLTEKLNEIQEARLDLTESKLIKAINNSEQWAIKFMMMYKGHERGYYKKFKQEVEGSEDKPLTIVVKHKKDNA